MEGIDYNATYDLVARLEAICVFIAYATHKNENVHQMDVKSALLIGKLKEEVYLHKPTRLENPDLPHFCYKLEKVVYCLKEAPRAW